MAPEAAQGRLFKPEHSVFVSANAGSGKTTLLTNRVLSLLVHGVLPGRILCLTFTNAAASEMSGRVLEKLGEWVMLDDVVLAKNLTELTGSAPDSRMMTRARGLFAKVLEAPDGVRIQTIHGFCQSLLRRFPVEAGVNPHFSLMDGRSEEEALREARLRLFTHIRDGNEQIQQAVQELAADSGEKILHDTLTAIVKNKRKLYELVTHEADIERTLDVLWRTLGCRPSDTPEHYAQQTLSSDAQHLATLRNIAGLLIGNGKRDSRRTAAALLQWLESARAWPDTERYVEAMLTDGQPYKTYYNSGALPDELADILMREVDAIVQLREKLYSLQLAQRTQNILLIAHSLLSLYQSLKESAARLDYDDLIVLATRLLTRPNISAWVLYKLDGGIDHVLVDEAQDTSPEQWAIIRALTGDFFSGQGRSTEQRSLFIVGDEKQSIYRFQGADVAQLGVMQDYFKRKIEDSGNKAITEELIKSYRSVPQVLQAVDAVFSDDEVRRCVMLHEDKLAHVAHRGHESGVVELWPLMTKEENQPPPQVRLVRQITEGIAEMLTQGMDAGDIMVLVRTRSGGFVDRLTRSLKRHGIPVAGADRMRLSENLAVQDLIALGQCMLLPEDDLTLACVLKSPIGGLSEEELFALAYERGKKSLWQCLQDSTAGGRITQVYELLAAMRNKADFLSPYAFYAHLLDTRGVRAQFIGRMGQEYADPIDEFLSQAMQYGRSHTPSLQGFLSWLAASEAEIKRDMEYAGGSVRIMTVHGAKGLQAPVVILPDTADLPHTKSTVLWHAPTGLPLWPRKVAHFNKLSGDLHALEKQADYAEYCRQLYVAMTRAEDRLIICGETSGQKANENSWIALVQRGLQGIATEYNTAYGSGLRLGDTPSAHAKISENISAAKAAGFDFLLRPAPEEPEPSRPLSPSRTADDDPAAASPLEARRSFSRGRLIHELLQYLPDVVQELQENTAQKLASGYARQMNSEDMQACINEAFAVLRHPELGFLFTQSGLAEVPVTGTVHIKNHPFIVSGQVDRLVLGDAVWIVDYKTGRQPPADVKDTPPAYLRQLALYRALFVEMQPQKPVQCALVWTQAAQITPIPAALLDAALNSTYI